MLVDVLLRLLEKRFPGKGILGTKPDEPCITFPTKHPDFGDIQILDDGDEITIIAGTFTQVIFQTTTIFHKTKRKRSLQRTLPDFSNWCFLIKSFFGEHINQVEGGMSWGLILCQDACIKAILFGQGQNKKDNGKHTEGHTHRVGAGMQR